MGFNCSNCNCSTRDWSTLFGQFEQFSLFLTTARIRLILIQTVFTFFASTTFFELSNFEQLNISQMETQLLKNVEIQFLSRNLTLTKPHSFSRKSLCNFFWLLCQTVKKIYQWQPLPQALWGIYCIRGWNNGLKGG